MHLSLVIPTYNEEQRIGATLEQVLEYLARQPYDAEVIVVDDGSRDRTLEMLGHFDGRTSPGVSIVPVPDNRGKGHAVRTGILEHARGDYRFFFDADASTPIDELEKCWPRFQDGADIVIGSRALPDSDVAVHQAWYRETMGRAYNVFLRMLGLTSFKDTQCGFKGFTAKACEVVFPRQTISRFSFDAEILFIAQRHGLRVDQVPVHWVNSPQSRVHPINDSTRMFLDLLAIRKNAAKGRYA